MALKRLGGGQGFVKAGFLGFQGSGKTYTSVLLAAAIRKQFGLKGPIALVDSENATAYVAPLVQELTGMELVGDRTRDFGQLVELGQECVKEGVSVLVADSMTHFWRSLCAGYLAGVNEARVRKGSNPRSRLEFQDWGILKDQWARWTDLYLNAPLHIIICGRAGYEYDMEKNEETGKNELMKTGIKMKTEGEFGFEPSLLVQMEVEQVPDKEDGGGFRQIRSCVVLKDRFGVIDGSHFQFRKGANHLEEMLAVANAFGPHINMLKPGAHSTVVTQASAIPVSEEGDVEWARERKSRTILCEEIQGCIVSAIPGQSAEEKKRKADLLQKIFGTRSWTAVESMHSGQLREHLGKLKTELGIVDPLAPKPAPSDDAPPGAEMPPDNIAQVRKLMETDKIRESVLLGFLAETGNLEKGCESLEMAHHKNPKVIALTLSTWPVLSKTIKDALGANT